MVVAPQRLMQNWPGGIIANLVNQVRCPGRPALHALHAYPWDSCKQLHWQPASGLREVFFSEGDRCIIKQEKKSQCITEAVKRKKDVLKVSSSSDGW